MKRFFLICLAAVICNTAAAQGQELTFELDAFSTLRVAGNLSVEIKPQQLGKGPSMTVRLNGNDAKSFVWSNRSDRLAVKMNYPVKGDKAVLTVYCDGITTIIADGADVIASSDAYSKMLDVIVKGGSNLNADIDCKDLKVKVTGESVAILSGKSAYAAAEVRGKSVLDTRKLEAKSMEVNARTKSETYVFSSERMIIDAAQNSKIFYKGAPDVLRSKTAAGAAVNSIGR